MSILNKLIKKKPDKDNNYNFSLNLEFSSDDYLYQSIYENVKENIDYIKKIQKSSWDLVTREMTLENKIKSLKIGLVFYAGLVDQKLLNKVIDGVVQNYTSIKDELILEDRFTYIKNSLIPAIGVNDTDQYGSLFNNLLSGDMIMFIEGCKKCIIIGARSYQERSVEKPTMEIDVKGSKDSFNENLLTNVSLIRKRIKNPHLIVNNYIIGKESNTNVTVIYIDGIADEKVLKEVKKRIESIRPHNIIDSSYIAEEIGEKNFSLFPRVYSTELPEKVASNLFEGRVAILVDSSPNALIVPCLFTSLLHASEDFFQKAVISSFFRLLRYFSLYIALFLPSLYISVVLHQAELLPINLLFSIAGQRATVPFPAFIELLIVSIAFDLLRESGARMPSQLGSTLSFVGAIVIGQSAVEAGLISQILVIVVVLTGIGTLTFPNYDLNLAVTFLRYLITIATILLGLYGLALATIVLIIHMASLKSFGVNYFPPISPFKKSGMKDNIIRMPLKNIFNESSQTNQK